MTKVQWDKENSEHTWTSGSLNCTCHPNKPARVYCESHSQMGIYLQATEVFEGQVLCAWCIKRLTRKESK